ncbi:MAG: hypothetical protein HY565_05210 [Candidatus Kerfeldbacteria bacterium]|nr:hypothetical protein [Candidatus Kerfeldbacteria bacterium]
MVDEPTVAAEPTPDQAGDLTSKINQELYKRNFELAVRNKTLSLLRDLYTITIETLASDELGKQVVRSIRKGLNFELTGLFVLNKEGRFLSPIAISSSPRAKEAVDGLEDTLMSVQIPLSDETNIAYQAIATTQHFSSTMLNDVWKPGADPDYLKKIREACNIHSAMVYPLVNDTGVMGVLVFALNRTYDDLSEFEHESIQSIVDVITIALDKSLLYDQLRIANQKLRELDQAKSEFMSIASHQLRTPLAGIVGYLSMLTDGDYGKMEPNQKEVVIELYQASQRLVRLVNTFLNVTRIEAGRFTMNFAEVNIVDVVTSEVKELQPTADKKGTKLIYAVPTEPIMATVDSDKIRDVFLNLIDNAIKYTPEGSVSVFVEQDGDQVHFHTKDTGVGIEVGESEHLFEKFVRGTGIARVAPNGSGLGLYIVKKITEAHNGKVWVESDGPGKGSSFHVLLPMQQAVVSEKK